MQIWVAISNNDLTSLDHKEVLLEGVSLSEKEGRVRGASRLRFNLENNQLRVTLPSQAAQKLVGNQIVIVAKGPITVASIKRAGGKGEHPSYLGEIRVANLGGKLRVSLRVSLDQYLRGVLTSEMPASYHFEALKCQALAARTYALKPRLPHDRDNANVCDSYMCCQYFAGLGEIDERIERAVVSTAGQVLTFKGKPILALFSSNAGGHTENYENCFSDPLTNEFPPQPLPYLAGRAEGKYTVEAGTEEFLRYLYQAAALKHDTQISMDSWTPKFHWRVRLSADALESQMHHVVEKLAAAADTAPFVIPPKSGKFGHIEHVEILKRGVSGVAIAMRIRTSTGDWQIKKELVIRKAFANSEIKLARLNSARIFFSHESDDLKLLKNLTVYGLGFGHGVGLQQTGAQGFAKAGYDYKKILGHYFPGSNIEVL
ncbi:SpoIID/LytB domain-containing protein [bacterium]|nr:SpoIID/LytB domain-containing protein [bacterium]MBP9809433.1 SpoIID/LytB domain-containing protein [bacterium]